MVSAEAFLTLATEWRAVLDRVDVTAVIVWVARSARGRVRNVQVCIGRWAQTPARLGLDRRADRSVVLR